MLRVRCYFRSLTVGASYTHGALKAQKKLEVNASFQRKVRIGFFDYAADFRAVRDRVSSDVAHGSLCCCEGDEGAEGDDL